MSERPRDLTKKELNKLQPEEYKLPIILLDERSHAEEVADACDRIRRGTNVIGFDTETKPTFKKNQYHKVALLQLSNGEVTLLVRLHKLDDKQEVKEIFRPLLDLLEDKSVLKVGIGLGDDVRELYIDHGIVTNHTLDLRTLAKADGIEALSLTKIYALLYGKRIAKGQQLSNWEAEQLSEAQMGYAALDALASYRIYRALAHHVEKGMISELDISAIQEEENEKLQRRKRRRRRRFGAKRKTKK